MENGGIPVPLVSDRLPVPRKTIAAKTARFSLNRMESHT